MGPDASALRPTPASMGKTWAARHDLSKHVAPSSSASRRTDGRDERGAKHQLWTRLRSRNCYLLGTATNKPKRTGTGYPHRRSGSEADSMSRGRYPVTGCPSSKPSSNKQTPTNEAAIRLTQAVNEALSSAVPKPHKPQQTKSASQGGAFHRGSDHFFFLGATIITIWRPSRRGIDST